jgi:hypothetical protein
MPERDDRQRVMEQMEEERDQRERRAMRSAGYGEDGPGGVGRLPPDRGGDRLRRDWDMGGRGGPGATPGPSPGSPPRGGGGGGGGGAEPRRFGGGAGPAGPDHRGRGPKGYRRSDERILEDVNDRLTEEPRVDASEIQVDVQGGEVTLTGTVGSREERRRAEDVAEGASGVTYVMNNLRVRQPGGSGATG